MLLFCEDPKVVNRRSCEHFVKISWQLWMRSGAVIWHPGDYFVTSYCDEWQLFDGWKIIFRRLVDDSVKMFDISDDFVTVTESLYNDLETTLWQASMKGQLYNNSMTALQILIWRPCDHAVSCDYTVTTLDTENKRSPIWQICRHRWHRQLSLWQLTMPPVMTMLSSWRYFAFSENISCRCHEDSLKKKVASLLLKVCIKQLHRYISRFHVHTWSQ